MKGLFFDESVADFAAQFAQLVPAFAQSFEPAVVVVVEDVSTIGDIQGFGNITGFHGAMLVEVIGNLDGFLSVGGDDAFFGGGTPQIGIADTGDEFFD